MIKSLFVSSVLILGSLSQAHAEVLSNCVTNNGLLSHQVSLDGDKLIGRFDFPTLRDFEVDPTGNTRLLNPPLSNDPIFTDNLDFLNKKTALFRSIFNEKAELHVVFDYCELQESRDKTLAARFCIKDTPTEINGVKIKKIEFSLQNQIRKSLIGNHGQTGQTHAVYADLLITSKENVAYRSSFTYFPDGNASQCRLSENVVYKKEKPDPLLISKAK